MDKRKELRAEIIVDPPQGSLLVIHREEYYTMHTTLSIIDGVEGVELSGIFSPTSEWHYVMVMKATSYEKALQVIKAYMGKYGRLKTSLGKIELLHTFEELGWQP